MTFTLSLCVQRPVTSKTQSKNLQIFSETFFHQYACRLSEHNRNGLCRFFHFSAIRVWIKWNKQKNLWVVDPNQKVITIKYRFESGKNRPNQSKTDFSHIGHWRGAGWIDRFSLRLNVFQLSWLGITLHRTWARFWCNTFNSRRPIVYRLPFIYNPMTNNFKNQYTNPYAMWIAEVISPLERKRSLKHF